MARAWVYDRRNSKDYREALQRAKQNGKQPPARWQVRYYNRAGKLRSEVATTKTRAEDRRTELEAALSAGTYVDPALSRVDFADIADKWLDARQDLRPSTWWKYRGLLDNHVNVRWGDLPLSAIEREDIAVWVASLLKSKEEGGAGLGPSQARHAYRVLTMVLEWCVPTRLGRNPAHGVKLPVRPDAEHVYLSYAQVEALANASATLMTKYARPTACAAINRALILLLAYTGLRWGEAASLRIGRVDLNKRRIRVATTFYEVKGVQCEGLPKTGKRRTVPIPASLVPVLTQVIGNRAGDELVFTTNRGMSLRANNWRVREFNAAVQAAELDGLGLTPHKLRHTAASLAIAAGADVKVIQQMLGHADASMTLNIYGHLWPDRLDDVAATLDARRRAALNAA
ncbi:putative prophage phiRv2 integrase [Longimycelium tulufanense]|uniref:Putative prophage phiRv2 integrase n=1 Tax=Longimycelium tulufanense TaxID=907463 RepID=A0A8J3CI97_9PSEU|nr:site-specific integrase [Longimycelium tulufanense]GGM79848.1 putative prophage phiRv2 integrase [Longimycelium tulufanense]